VSATRKSLAGLSGPGVPGLSLGLWGLGHGFELDAASDVDVVAIRN